VTRERSIPAPSPSKSRLVTQPIERPPPRLTEQPGEPSLEARHTAPGHDPNQFKSTMGDTRPGNANARQTESLACCRTSGESWDTRDWGQRGRRRSDLGSL
jgi:hypothetical protein